MLHLSLGMPQEVETICTSRLQLGWLDTLTMVVCGMKLTPQLFQLHLFHSHFRASPPFFAPSVAADIVHVMWGKTKDIACNSGNCHTQPTYFFTDIYKLDTLHPFCWWPTGGSKPKEQSKHISCCLRRRKKELLLLCYIIRQPRW